MSKPSLIESLNPAQVEAITTPDGHTLVLAGAGSGKTRVLVHRIAWLITEQQVSPYAILAVTFTNKAAREMRGRIETLLDMPIAGMWVGTFHGIAHRLLRAHWQAAQLPESFQLLDGDDQLRLVRRIHKSLELDEKKWAPKQSQWFINKQKEEGRRCRDIANDQSYFTEIMLKVYSAYETICQTSGLVDFSELLEKNADLRKHYQQRFQHLLIDEFQDTNTIQYRWIQILNHANNHVMAVGDDDQSIYSWRGAKVENIQRFEQDFAPIKIIRLEQNYRSTQTILSAANAVIDNNQNRMGKKLWTQGEQGAPISLYAAFNERDEAHFITCQIQHWLSQGYARSAIAILYRSNAQSRVLEEKLLEMQIPYRIYGGQKFFERAEIKDVLAYLRLVANRNDDAAFERIVNTPTRGIGNTTLSQLRLLAREQTLSLWQATQQVIQAVALSARALTALKNFTQLIEKLDQETQSATLGEQAQHTLQFSGLLAMYRKDKTEKGLSRSENLEEFITAADQFTPGEADEEFSPLAAFLAHVALEAGEQQADEHTDSVSLMTLHAAKGLEFPLVFISGMEEGLFPHKMSTEEAHGLEEERRLCYVGMTRAMHKLYLTHAECRRLYHMEQFNPPSRFIAEVPTNLIDTVRTRTKISRPTQYRQSRAPSARPINLKKHDIEGTDLQVGQSVTHAKFGRGIIINYEGRGENTRVQVKFEKAGAKWLVTKFAKLS